jgi:hypothetical protein
VDFYDYLDTTRISTGVLYNKVIPYSSFMDYTGTNDTVVSSSENWYQLYFELYNAHLGTPAMPDILALTDSVQAELNAFRVPIGILTMNYNLIKDSALINNLLVIQDSVLHDGPNTSESPYTSHRCFVAAALIDDCPLASVTFLLRDDYLFENTGEEVMNYIIDFNDGQGPQILDPNDDYTVEYSTTGVKNLEIEAWMIGGTVLRCTATFTVSEVNPIMQRAARAAQSPPNNTYEDAVVSAVYENETYTGNFGIWYGCESENQIRKPVIFVEGYDPHDQNTLSGGEMYALADQKALATDLRNQGCDIIMLDFKDGAAKIQANAMVLKALIDTINAMKVTHNELVIIGASMGGLVARYALSYMEQQQEDHQTRLFISYDSPHQGAYGTLGGQHLLAKLGKVSNVIDKNVATTMAKAIKKSERFVNSDAAKQMLVYHHSATDGKKAKPHPMRTAFLNDMASLPNNGYPERCRNIAIACGSGTGVGQGFAPGAQQLNWDTVAIYGLLKFKLRINALPDHIEREILNLDMKVHVPWPFLRWIIWTWIPVPYLSDIHVKVNNTDPYDNCPGGKMDILKGLDKAIREVLGQSGDYNSFESFVPTVSALDLNKGYLESITTSGSYLMTNIYDSIIVKNPYHEFTNHDITPFDTIYVGQENLFHVTGGGISTMTASWMMNEIIRDTIQFKDVTFSTVAKQYEAKTCIIAGLTDGAGVNHPVVIDNGADITFLAGESITLKPGFHVEQGATFNARIHAYNGTIQSPSSQIMAYSPLRKGVGNSGNSPMSIPLMSNSLRKESASIIPNPSQGSFTVNTGLAEKEIGVITIFDLLGKQVISTNVKGGKKQLVLEVPHGMYLVRVTKEDHQAETIKLIIKH